PQSVLRAAGAQGDHPLGLLTGLLARHRFELGEDDTITNEHQIDESLAIRANWRSPAVLRQRRPEVSDLPTEQMTQLNRVVLQLGFGHLSRWQYASRHQFVLDRDASKIGQSSSW